METLPTVIIRQSKEKYYKIAGISILSLLYYFLGPYDYTRVIYKNSPKFTILLGCVAFCLLLFSIAELLLQKGEIILTADGIELRGKGWNHWDLVESYRTVLKTDYENNNEYLIIRLKDATELKCAIDDLDKHRMEICRLINEYGPGVTYEGHRVT